jgi:adenosylmethionine-8-amino-7-oxononanoate aminotransferase
MSQAAPVHAATDTDTDRIWRQDHDHFVHPFTHFDSFRKDGSLVISRAKGARIEDSRGRRYLDGIGGLWCMSIGFGEEEMAEAIAEQVRRLSFYSAFVDTTNQPAAELAAKLADLAPGDLDRVFFTCGGSTANDTAVRLIHYYNSRRGKSGKRHMIARVGGYHGSTYIAMSLTGRESDRSPDFGYETGWIHHVSCPNPYRRPEGMSVEEFRDFLVDELESKILEIGPGTSRPSSPSRSWERAGSLFPHPATTRRHSKFAASTTSFTSRTRW